MKRILFVDDEPHVLDSLRDALRRRRGEWDMTFAPGGEAALAALEAERFDVVVCDIRMPEVDGIAVLSEVARRHPQAARIVLSGYAEVEEVARAATVAHRFVAKPCEPQQLTAIVERSLALQELGHKVGVCGAIAGITHLPSPPRVYAELVDLLGDSEATLADAAAIVERDIALCAKVLQLANSAFFSPDRPITNLREAIARLGLDALKVLVLSAEAFHGLRPNPPIDRFDIEALERHCTAVAGMAGDLLSDERGRGIAAAGGLLHDVGQLLLASESREHFSQLIATAHQTQRPLIEVERDRGAITHAELGAHLLAAWGLPHEIVEIVAHHHDPPPTDDARLDPLAAVYLANALIAEHEHVHDPDQHPPPRGPDPRYVNQLGVAGMIDGLRELAARHIAAPYAGRSGA